LGVNLVGIINSEVGLEEFQTFFEGDVYLDPKLQLFQKYCLKLGWRQILGSLTSIFQIRQLNQEGITGNLVAPEESKHYMDAIFVVGPNGKIFFKHLYQSVTDYPNDWQTLVAAAKDAASHKL